MDESLRIKRVSVEFLRPGPPHNQLLSPLTQYLAVCGEAAAGVVTVPYEQAAFERRLKELRYETGDPDDRAAMLHDVGVEMAKILGAIPTLPGSLTLDPADTRTMVHLRLTLSPAELAYLPFELAKVPVNATTTNNSFLAVQARPPVCITRTIRTVPVTAMQWPTAPRILFICGDPDSVPFHSHREVLLDATADFIEPPEDPDAADGRTTIHPDAPRQQFGDLLTILRNPTLREVMNECHDTAYTHVHVLTHGDQYGTGPDHFGLVLGDDVISGDCFASALVSVRSDRIHQPSVVTIASCDSGNIGTVMIPGASFAHALHQAGIAFVVASQFPLSKDGSVPLTSILYEGLLRGENPLVLLQQVRSRLFALYNVAWHDWGSVVVYESLPQSLDEHLDEVRYRQTKRALYAALSHLDRAVSNIQKSAPHNNIDSHVHSVDQRCDAIERALTRLPMGGAYRIECIGLDAGARKRIAQAAFLLRGRSEAKRLPEMYELLQKVLKRYRSAGHDLLTISGRVTQRVASVDWVLTQACSIAAALGETFDVAEWHTAKLCADLHSKHQNSIEAAWGHGSLAELELLTLPNAGLSPEARQDAADSACGHALQLVQLAPERNHFVITSTLAQFRRYVDWWGSPTFVEGLLERGRSRPDWSEPGGVIDTARKIIKILEPPKDSGSHSNGGGQTLSDPPPPSDAGPSNDGHGGNGQTAGALRTSGMSPSNVREREGVFFDVTMLPAGHGDAIWIEYGEGKLTHRLLIDCGVQATAKTLLSMVEAIPTQERMVELFVMSHIDSDHIGGALPFLAAIKRDLLIGDVWFNGWRHVSAQLGARQGEMFSTAIQTLELRWNAWRDGDAIVLPDDRLLEHTLPGGMRLTLLSPGRTQLERLAPVWTRELKRYGLVPGGRVNYSGLLKGTPSTSTDIDELAETQFAGDGGAPNGSSIALLAEFGGASVLLGADAHAPVLVASIRKLLEQRGGSRLAVDAFKVSHHGSQNNVSRELIQLLDCKRYLLSSNGSHFSHPDRQAVARIVKYGRASTENAAGPALYFNYDSTLNRVWRDPAVQERHPQYPYSTSYPQTVGDPMRVRLLPGH